VFSGLILNELRIYLGFLILVEYPFQSSKDSGLSQTSGSKRLEFSWHNADLIWSDLVSKLGLEWGENAIGEITNSRTRIISEMISAFCIAGSKKNFE
jgi:hypothetical protein